MLNVNSCYKAASTTKTYFYSLDETLYYPIYIIKTKVVFLEGWLFSSQSELFEYFLNCSDWLDKSKPSKKTLCFDHVNRLYANFGLLMFSGKSSTSEFGSTLALRKKR